MIPTLEDIIRGLFSGDYEPAQARGWIDAHIASAICRAATEVAEPAKVFLVATGLTVEGQETYTRHDVRPRLCDAEVLYTAAPDAAGRDALDRTALRDAIAESLTCIYVCGRAWEAWGVGTMSQDDFSPAGECDEVLDGIMGAIDAALSTTGGRMA